MDENGNNLYVSVDNEEITFTTDEEISYEYGGSRWDDVHMETDSEQLKALALYGGEPNTYCYIDSTDREYFPVRGGSWSAGTSAGVFSLNLHISRTATSSSIGFRSAYYKKH